MDRLKAALPHTLPALIVIATAALVQLFLITRPLDFLLTNVFPDDAFYYFEIARNIARGAGSTFDGLAATNGYHPLWMRILVPIYKMFGTGVGTLEPIRAALIVSLLLNTITGYVVWLILGRFTRHVFARTLGLAMWALNPFLIYQSINGLETSISLFFIALLLWRALTLEEKTPGKIAVQHLVALGIVGGLCILARIDTAVYVGAVLLFLWLRDLSWQSFAQAAIAGLVVTAVVTPWLVWNVTNFGMLLTSSSGANTLVNHTLIYQDNGTGIYQTAKGTLYNLHGQLGALMTRTGAPGLSFMLFGSALVLLCGVWTLPRAWREVTVTHAFAFGFALLFFLNVGVRWTGRPWYFVSFGILLAILAAVVVDAIRLRWRYGERTKQYAAAALSAALMFSFFVWWHKELTDSAPQQREMYAAALWLNDNIPVGRIGVFNAGIMGYFSTAEVVNLDGLVNNDAYEAMRERRLFAYLRDADITHVADFPIYLTYRYQSFWGIPDITTHLEEIETVFVGGHNRSRDGLHIYRVQ